ncbi:S-layer homology domain-containing protein [Tepidimicrobium xylanilyticum]
MFIKKFKIVSIIMAMVLILSQGIVFAGNVNAFAIKISGPGVEKELEFSLDDLKAMPEEAQINEEYIYNSKSGQKSVKVKGVSLAYILEKVAGLTVENALVNFEASDGYPIDPQTLQDILNQDLKYILAYEIDGEPIDNDDNPESEEIVIYRKLKEEGEFGTVFKLVVRITVGEAIEQAEESVKELTKPEIEPVKEIEEIVFTDITEEYKFAETAIYELAKRGIVSGVGNNIFAPGDVFTRAQFCKIAVEAIGYELEEYSGNFTDVKAENWFAPYVEAAVREGLFTGYTDGTFRPDKEITREELAAVVGRAAVLAGLVDQEKMNKFVMEKTSFEDKDEVSSWAANQVAWLDAQGVFKGVAEEKFEPKKVVTRAEAALIVYNALFNK